MSFGAVSLGEICVSVTKRNATIFCTRANRKTNNTNTSIHYVKDIQSSGNFVDFLELSIPSTMQKSSFCTTMHAINLGKDTLQNLAAKCLNVLSRRPQIANIFTCSAQKDCHKNYKYPYLKIYDYS